VINFLDMRKIFNDED